MLSATLWLAFTAIFLTFSLNTVGAFWRMPCLSRSGLAQIDPLVSKGTVSGHVHAIRGSSGIFIFCHVSISLYEKHTRALPFISIESFTRYRPANTSDLLLGFSKTSGYDAVLAGECTSCQVSQDHPAYWTPALYFQHAATGEYELVEQLGGMLA
jgi:hypothetical protein